MMLVWCFKSIHKRLVRMGLFNNMLLSCTLRCECRLIQSLNHQIIRAACYISRPEMLMKFPRDLHSIPSCTITETYLFIFVSIVAHVCTKLKLHTPNQCQHIIVLNKRISFRSRVKFSFRNCIWIMSVFILSPPVSLCEMEQHEQLEKKGDYTGGTPTVCKQQGMSQKRGSVSAPSTVKFSKISSVILNHTWCRYYSLIANKAWEETCLNLLSALCLLMADRR